jgi:hypothetical protein
MRLLRETAPREPGLLSASNSADAGVAGSGLQNRGLQVRVLPGLSETLAPSCFAARAFVPWNSARLSV